MINQHIPKNPAVITSVFQNSDLSYAARGAYGYLASLEKGQEIAKIPILVICDLLNEDLITPEFAKTLMGSER